MEAARRFGGADAGLELGGEFEEAEQMAGVDEEFLGP
jgi:hypothetical protein